MKQFNNECLPDEETEIPTKHFQGQVPSLSEIIKQMRNSFLDDFPDLVTLDNRNCTDKSVIAIMHTLELTCKE